MLTIRHHYILRWLIVDCSHYMKNSLTWEMFVQLVSCTCMHSQHHYFASDLKLFSYCCSASMTFTAVFVEIQYTRITNYFHSLSYILYSVLEW